MLTSCLKRGAKVEKMFEETNKKKLETEDSSQQSAVSSQ
jgi:hypothetical protein